MSPVMEQRVAAAPAADRPPNLAAQRLTGRTYLSHSQISLMRSCPRKFAFSYIENAPRDFIPSSLIFGGSIHAALEVYFRGRLEGVEITAADLLIAFGDAWDGQKADAGGVPVRFNKADSEEKLHALTVRMIAAFLASPLAAPKGTILGIEEELRIVLDPDLPDVLAKVDLVTQTDGALHDIDFKTSRSRWTEQKAAESGEQLVLYGQTVLGISSSLGLPVKLHFAVLTKHKTPLVQLLPIITDDQRVAALRDGIAQVWEAIQAGSFYPSPSPQNCTTCPFRSRCPAMTGK